MSLALSVADTNGQSFPRVSGDEPPGDKKLDLFTVFSPRERG